MNDKMTATKELQQRLRDIAKTDSNIISVIPDGIFGEETEDSVKSFQRKIGQTDTGIVDFDLWERIGQEHKKALFILSEPLKTTNIRNEDLPLRQGQESAQVGFLNFMLNDLSEKFLNFQSPPQSNFFSEETKRQVENWQRVIFHEVTGEVDKQTWNTLSEFHLM